MEKKLFVVPNIEIISIDTDDIICTSGVIDPLAPTQRDGDSVSTYGGFFGN